MYSSTLHFGDLAQCVVELLPHVVIRRLCVAWRYVTAVKPPLEITYHATGSHKVTLQIPSAETGTQLIDPWLISGS